MSDTASFHVGFRTTATLMAVIAVAGVLLSFVGPRRGEQRVSEVLVKEPETA